MLLKTRESRRCGGEVRRAVGGMGMALLLAWGVACGPAGELQGEAEQLSDTRSALGVDNGLVLNGLVLNGLVLNGLVLNGLVLNGLSTTSFQNWFQADPTLRTEVMKYLVSCAVPAGQTRSFTDSNTGITHVWAGSLGLAPGWSSGSPATVDEQQVVSGCMAAHGNKFSIHITVSLRGQDATGTAIPTTSQERSDYTVPEGCFFGNLFDGTTGVFGGNDGLSLTSSQSSPRVCGLPGTQCSPMGFVGSCASACTLDATGSYYTSCSHNGVTYKPITTRMRPADIYTCGDGVCQATEQCGTGSRPDSCAADCGACP